jgi:hypothetical protein
MPHRGRRASSGPRARYRDRLRWLDPDGRLGARAAAAGRIGLRRALVADRRLRARTPPSRPDPHRLEHAWHYGRRPASPPAGFVWAIATDQPPRHDGTDHPMCVRWRALPPRRRTVDSPMAGTRSARTRASTGTMSRVRSRFTQAQRCCVLGGAICREMIGGECCQSLSGLG